MSRRARLSVASGFVLSLAVAAPVVADPAPAMQSAGAARPLPACRSDDVRTRYDRPPQRRKSLLAASYKLLRRYLWETWETAPS